MVWGLTARRAATLALMLAIAICIPANAPSTAQASAAASSNDGALVSSHATLRTVAKSMYKIAFKANGGKGTMAAQTTQRLF